MNILGLKRRGSSEFNITPATVLSEDMTLLVLGEYKALQKCFRI